MTVTNLEDDVHPILREALDRAIEEVADLDCEVTVVGGFIMAFSIADAIGDGEVNSDRLVEIALRAIDETTVH